MTKNIFSEKSGFTLVELLVSMGIFIVFIGVIMFSYTGIVSSQADLRQQKELYSDFRLIMDKIEGYAKSSYFFSDGDVLLFVSADAKEVNKFYVQDGGLHLWRNVNCGEEVSDFLINSEFTTVENFDFEINDSNGQSYLRVYLGLERAEYFDFLQSTFSLRYLGEIPEIDFTCWH